MGLVTAVSLADAGNEIVGIDTDQNKINDLSNGIIRMYEPKLNELFLKNKSKFTLSSDYKMINEVDLIYIIVPTPTINNKIDLGYAIDASENIQKNNKNAVIVIKSTVIPGTARMIHKKTGLVVISNPEFTKEGEAINDTIHPDRIVIGGSDKKAIDRVEKLWKFTNAPIIRTSNENAEMIKYASNAFLAAKISFINNIADLCEKIPGSDVDVVAKAMGYDKRIAPYFLKAGLGYGGSCFPKDTKAINSYANELGVHLDMIEATIKSNEARIEKVAKLAIEIARISKAKSIGILGIAFKNNTDDTRESQALKLVQKLKDNGNYNINVYDPAVKIMIKGTRQFSSKEECIKNSDIIVIATEWEEFKNIKTSKPVIDARRILDPMLSNVFSIGFGKAKDNEQKTKWFQ